MAAAAGFYPLVRRPRRAHSLRGFVTSRAGRRIAAAAMTLALLAGTVGAIVWTARRAARPDAAAATAAGAAALARNDHTAARDHFLDALSVAPGDAATRMALARSYLMLEDGAAAQGALERARAAGIAPARLHGLRAAALVMQGDADGALAEAGRAPRGDVEAARAAALALVSRGDVQRGATALEAIVAAQPGDARSWMLLGRVRLDRGDVGGAAAAVQRSVTIDRGDPAALTLAGEVVRSRYGLLASLPWFEAALQRDAACHPALIEYAATLGDAGRHADAVAAAQRALRARAGSPQALYLLAVVAARAGRLDLAATLLERTGGALDGLPGGLLLSGGIDYAAGRYEQAAVKWQALLGRQPMNLVARRLLGAAMLRAGDAAAALATLRPIALRQDADSYTLNLVARAFEATGDRGRAGRFLDRAAQVGAMPSTPFGQDEDGTALAEAMKEAPDDPGAAVSWLRGELEQGRGAAALAQARRMAAASPGAPAAQMLSGDVQFARAGFGDAVTAYRRTADLSFTAPVMLRLVEAQLRAGERRAAAETLALYLSQNPRAVEARRMLAGLQLEAGDARAALRTLDSLNADLGARDALLLAQTAAALSAAGDPAAALAPARAAYRLAPMNVAACDALGWALYLRGRRGAGVQLLTKAARIAPSDPAVRRHLAMALANGRREGAG